MHVGSLPLCKVLTMKSHLFFKVCFLIPLFLFVDYIIMILVGCTTCLFGIGGDFYCGTYCIIGKTVLAASAILFLFIIFPDIKKLFKTITNATTKKAKKSI